MGASFSDCKIECRFTDGVRDDRQDNLCRTGLIVWKLFSIANAVHRPHEWRCGDRFAADRHQKSAWRQTRTDLRSVIIHGQTMREDQLDAAREIGLAPSFFPIHVAFWGDRHKVLFLGPDRAARIDPAQSALDRGLRFTLHHDAPIAGIDMLAVISAAVNRKTTGGEVIGPEQRIAPIDALRAVTLDAAWQYFEEDRKGSLAPGKLADLVILSANSLDVAPLDDCDDPRGGDYQEWSDDLQGSLITDLHGRKGRRVCRPFCCA